MQDYLELIERFDTGARMSKEDWDFDAITMTTRNLVKKYRLSWEPDVVIPNDPDLVDRIFQAGLELVNSVGVYSLSTGRVLAFKPDEVEDAFRQAPQTLIMGEGNDACTLYARRVMDSRLPLVWAGNPGCPTPEELFLPYVMSCMQEPVVDLITCGSLTHVDGHEVRTGEPAEIAATRRELNLLHEGLKKVSRPGMGMLAAQSSVSELGDLAVAHPSYLRPCDAHLVPVLNELIMDNRNIARVVNSLEYGMRNASLACVMVGGLGGDASGSAVLQVASFLAANLTCLAHYHLLHPIHIRHVATSTRSVMWVQGAVEQAFTRNAPCIIVGDIYPKSGALTRELLYEVAANAIAITVSGGHLEGVGSADGALPNGTGLEARWMGEVGQAVARQGLDLEEANALVIKLLAKYEFIFQKAGGNPGERFDRAYDPITVTPVPEWLRMYEEVKRDVRELGLDV
ncbi:MAG: monomethylamine:corrinoid methyltransferase [Chloroflexi bacterium]|nr:monomethylamine:corrinoid methyltransferase [Chloroflexota bacterium]